MLKILQRKSYKGTSKLRVNINIFILSNVYSF